MIQSMLFISLARSFLLNLRSKPHNVLLIDNARLDLDQGICSPPEQLLPRLRAS